jgi:hypothetical protein
MGTFRLFSGNGGKVYGKNAKRKFAPHQKRPNPNSNRSTGNTSRFKRF